MTTIFICVSQDTSRSLNTEKLETCMRLEVGFGHSKVRVRSTKSRAFTKVLSRSKSNSLNFLR